VIAYSQRYHYPNAWIGDGSDINSTSVHAGDLAALIVSLRLGRVHLIGSSYGSDIVLRLAVEHSELVRTLVVAEPALFSWLVTLQWIKICRVRRYDDSSKGSAERGLGTEVRLYVDHS
jgi:pimeloyl-ACP methyl ester carboxylesterase